MLWETNVSVMKYTPIHIVISYLSSLSQVSTINEYVFSLLLIFIIYYIVTFTNLMLFLFNFNLQSVVFLSSLQNIISFKIARLLLILVLLNLAGVPPTPTFFIKISLLSLLYTKGSMIVLVVIFLLIVSGMIFYLQVIRFLIGTQYKPIIYYENSLTLLSKSLINLLISVTIINITLTSTILDISTIAELILLI